MARTSSHHKAVYEILPQFAERLKKNGVISAYDRKQFRIPLVKGLPEIRINPDLVLYLPDKVKVLVEVANPCSPKRLIGEIVYPHILGHFKLIESAIVFILPSRKGRKIDRSIHQEMALDQFFGKTIPSILLPFDPNDPEEAYSLLYHALTSYQQFIRRKK